MAKQVKYTKQQARKERFAHLLSESLERSVLPVPKDDINKDAFDWAGFFDSIETKKIKRLAEKDYAMPEWQRIGIENFKQQRPIERVDKERPDFIFSMSYGRSVGFISKHDRVNLYNGSSLNRKDYRKKEDKELTEDEEIELAYNLYKYTPSYGLNKHDITHLKKQSLRKRSVGMSRRTKLKVEEKLLAFYRACSGRNGYRSGVVNFTFITLSFIDQVTDRKGIDILDKFLTVLRQKYSINKKLNYLWVAERQENGNIHFHLIVDSQFPIDKINALWVVQQVQSGLKNDAANNKVQFVYGKNFKQLYREKEYKKIQEFLNPCDIKKIKTIDGISCYLTNYVTKNDTVIHGAQWNASMPVSRLFTKKIISINQFMATCNKSKNWIKNNHTGKVYINETYRGEWCTINNIYNKGYYRRFLDDLESLNKIILQTDKKEIALTKSQLMGYVSIPKKQYRTRFFTNQVVQRPEGDYVLFTDRKKDLVN